MTNEAQRRIGAKSYVGARVASLAGFSPTEATVAKWGEEFVPQIAKRRTKMPPIQSVERYFPYVSRAQIQAAMDIAKLQLDAKAFDTLDDMLNAMFGTGIYIIPRGQYLLIIGLGDPTQWSRHDAYLFQQALGRAFAAMRAASSPSAVASRIERNGIPALRDVAVVAM